MWKPMNGHCVCGKMNWNHILVAAPAVDWHEAAEKARYLLKLFGASMAGQDPRRQTLIEAVLADFERLSDAT